MKNVIEHNKGKRLAKQAVQSVIDSGDTELFSYMVENLSGDEFFKQGFYTQIAELAGQAVELEAE